MARERGRRNVDEKFPEPDILPLMNVILMLILALITMSALLPLGFLSSEAQKLAKGGGVATPTSEEKKPLNLIVFITDSGFNLSVRGAVSMGAPDPSNPSRKLPLIPKISATDGTLVYDYQALELKLIEIKKLDPTEEAMTLTADPEVQFDSVIQTMDASRFDLEKRPLFPRVSFAAGIVG
jgi:biopolymer transport protein ExbD